MNDKILAAFSVLFYVASLILRAVGWGVLFYLMIWERTWSYLLIGFCIMVGDGSKDFAKYIASKTKG